LQRWACAADGPGAAESFLNNWGAPGRPDNAPHTKYLDWLYRKLTGGAPERTLSAVMAAAAEATR